MSGTSSAATQVARITAPDLKTRLQAGEPATILDARQDKAWDSSDVKIRGAFRIDANHFQINPNWPKNRLTVVY
jgi:hypothetical protein